MLLHGLAERVSAGTVVAAGIVAYVLLTIGRRIYASHRINSLGGRASKIKTKIPFGLGIIYKAVVATMQHKNLDNFETYMRESDNDSYTVETTLLSRRMVFTADPENIKAILATQFGDYGKGEPFHEDWKEFMGDGIFATDAEKWHSSRQLIRPQFIKDRVSDLHTFEQHVQILLQAIANGGVKGVPGVAADGIAKGRRVDVADLFFRYALDAATDFLLGRSVGSLEIPRQEFAEAFNEVQRVQNIISRAGPLKTIVPKASFRKGLKVMDAFVEQYVDQALNLSPEELATKTKSESGYTFLHALASFTRDRKVLRDQLVAVLLAGRDTTAASLSWTFYELARNPAIFSKLRQEIISTVGLANPPTYTDLKSMKYLQNTMNEILRLYPVVPFNVRLALKDTTLPHGGGPDGFSPIGVLKDTPIAYSTLMMQRRADLYPTPTDPSMDVLAFNPDRWLTWQPKPWLYIPFNGGPRICIGQQFALTEMSYTIVRMLQRFDRIDNYMPEKGPSEPLLKAEIVLQPGDGVHVAFWDVGVTA